MSTAFDGLLKSQVTPLSWNTISVYRVDNSLTGSGFGGAYDAVGFAPLPVLGNGINGYYVTVNFNGSGGYAYAGLTQTMTTFDPVSENASKIDAGFKCDGGNIVPVIGGTEFLHLVLGDSSSNYQVVFDGTNYLFYKDGSLVFTQAALANNENGYRAGVAFYDATTVTLTAGNYTGSTIPIPPSEPLNVAVNTDTPGNITVTWDRPTSVGSGLSYYTVQYVATAAPNTVLGSGTVNVGSTRTKTFTGVTDNTELTINITAYNTNEQAGGTASYTLTTPGWYTPSEPRNVTVNTDTPETMTVTWDPPTSLGSGVSYYRVQYVATAAPNTVLGVDDVYNDRTATFTSVSSSTVYTVKVTAYNLSGTPGPTASLSLTTPGWNAPSAPRDVTIRSDSPHEVTVSWKKPVSAGFNRTIKSYNVYVKDAISNSYSYSNILHDNTTTTFEYTQKDIYAGKCEAYVTAVNDQDVEGTYSDTVEVTVDGIAPLPLTNITTDNSVPLKLTVTWTIDQRPPVATKFNVIAFLAGLSDIAATAISVTGTSTELTLPAGTYDIAVTSLTPLGGLTTTIPPIYGVVVSGGGGKGGGGGNNGGNGHNNMSAAALEYNYPDWSATVTQENTITVLGEDSAALPDETIVINVSLGELQECVVYDSNWVPATGEAAGSQPLPKVEFRPSESYAAGHAMDAMFGSLKAKGTGTVGDRTFNDDASASHDQFGKILINNVTFTGSVLESNDLPKVAIRSIEEGNITVDNLTTTVAKVDTENSASHKAYLEGLFEQLVAADRIKGNDAASTNAAAWGSCKKPSLQAGDSISFKVTYNFSKTRKYEVDGLDSGNGNSGAKALTLTIAGQTFTIQPGADGLETSDPYSRSYAFKLVAV